MASFASDNDIEYKAKDYTREKFRNLSSLAARNWAFQACSGEQWTVESSFLACLVLRVDHARGKKTYFYPCLQLSAGPPDENGTSLSSRTMVLGLHMEFVFSLR